MRIMHVLLLALLLGAANDSGALPDAVIVNDFGDAGPGNCNSTCTLRDAIAVALAADPIKPVTFSAASGWPQAIALTQGQLAISNPSANSFMINGPGASNLSISAGNTSRVFDLVAGSLFLGALTVRDGNNTGMNAGSGSPQSGEAGDSAGISMGGCVRIAEGVSAEFDHIAVHHCAVTGGKGGNGGTGMTVFGTGGTGGSGGGGGQAAGGGIYTAGNLILRKSSVTLSSATGGTGGAGGAGGGGFVQGEGGAGGSGGLGTGGAVYVTTTGTLLLQNSTLATSTSVGATGGIGGDSGTTTAGGHGGAGGDAYGSLLHAQGLSGMADVEFSTLANGTAIPAPGGPGGAGSPGGAGGNSGSVHGAAIWGGGNATVLSSIVVGASAFPLCALNVAAAPGSANIDQDSSCSGFSLHKTFAEVLRNADPAPTPAYLPVYKGSAVDAAATCTDIGGSQLIADDQHDTPRPQGSACDLGAIEADYIFASSFD